MCCLPLFPLMEKVEQKDQVHSMRCSVLFDDSSDECAVLTDFCSYTVPVSLGVLIEDILALVFIRPSIIERPISFLANKQGA
jgi:hypothetical protein